MATDDKKMRSQYDRAKEAYLLLKNNFNQIGRYDDASWAYVKEQQMEKMGYYWEWAAPFFSRWRPLVSRPWRFLRGLAAPQRQEPLLPRLLRYRHNGPRGQELTWPAFIPSWLSLVRSVRQVVFWLATPYPGEPLLPRMRRRLRKEPVWPAFGPFRLWLRSWAYELITGYGERPANPIFVGALMILGFGLGFRLTGAITSLQDAMIYSMATFATFNLSRQGLSPDGIGAEVASSAEALLGIGILALFVFTLGNRMSRG